MLPLTLRREGRENSGGRPTRELKGSIRAIKWLPYLEIGFGTDLPERNSIFLGYISDFETLAKEMVKADPEAAIKAFGAAMQQVSFSPKPQQDTRAAQVASQTADAES